MARNGLFPAAWSRADVLLGVAITVGFIWYFRRRASRPAFEHVTQYDDQGRPIPPIPPID